MADDRSVVYLIGSAESHRVKIGKSIQPEIRLAEIQRMSPAVLSILWTHPGGLDLEAALHQQFASARTHGEWFDFGAEDPVTAVAAAVQQIEERWAQESAQYAALAAARDESDRIFDAAMRSRIRAHESGIGPLARGDVYYADLGYGDTPWLVVSNNARNARLGNALAVRITNAAKPELPSIVEMDSADPVAGCALCDDVTLLDLEDANRGAGALTAATMMRVAEGLRHALAL